MKGVIATYLAIVAVLVAVALVIAVRRHVRARSVRRRLQCPRTGAVVDVTLSMDSATQRCVNVEDCSALRDPDAAEACTRGCIDVVNLHLDRR